jgi:hypothetical protein
MSVQIAGSSQRLSLQLPGEGKGWKRQGDEMIEADLGGSGGTAYERVAAEGPLSPTVAHTDLALDGTGGLTYPLADGTIDGFRKSIRVYEASTEASHITGNFRTGNFANTNVASIDVQAFGDVPDELELMWVASISKWVIVRENIHLNDT